jgi:hypothetical protein
MDESGWTQEQPEDNQIEVAWRQSGDGVYVEIAVVEEASKFVVTVHAEHRCSGPNITRSEPFATAQEAAEAACEKRKDWDRAMSEWDAV